ncbi:uncharacterized protein LOC105182269 isoform X2 [Harpegnathos saltator]|uniref:Uncharacterized protein n=2 Tax=Harpegnathos saltator TaxID=610380 RepID=E2BFM5_HARSA|nr:uncharacterized protein LOC105182269 isoform X2 [Harpegnathos saltator]EFN85547.1 hypothetical protein EAI_09199 [Harpegnathos saltator]
MVNTSENKVSLSAVDDNSDFSKKSNAQLGYGNFQKSSVHNNSLVQDDSAMSKKEEVTTTDTILSPIEKLMFPKKESSKEVKELYASLSYAKLERIKTQDALLSKMKTTSRIYCPECSLRSNSPPMCDDSTFRPPVPNLSLPPDRTSSFPVALKYISRGLSLPLGGTYTRYFTPDINWHYKSNDKLDISLKDEATNMYEQYMSGAPCKEGGVYNTNNNTLMVKSLEPFIFKSKFGDRRHNKKINDIIQQLTSCNIKESDKKVDFVDNKKLQKVKKNRKECLKMRRKPDCVQFVKEIAQPCMTKEYSNKQTINQDEEYPTKQTREQNEEECRLLGINPFNIRDAILSKEENCKLPLEQIIKQSTCLLPSMKYRALQHENDGSAARIANTVYLKKSIKNKKNKRRQNLRINDVIQNIVNKQNANAVDVVSKALKEIKLTEDVSTTIKKKFT